MRIVFMGTPEFASAALECLVASEHELALVVTQPDRRAGRGKKLQAPPVKALAEKFGIEVFQPEKINTRSARARVVEAKPDVVVVVAFGQILRPLFLALPRHGCLNVHASLLPRHRGASPINAQILHNDLEVGVTIMRMDEGLDTGPIGLRAALPANPRETAGELHDRLAPLGGKLIVEALDALEVGDFVFEPQQAMAATYAGLMSKTDGQLDFRRSAFELDRQVRAYNPWPGAYADLISGDDPHRLKVLECLPQDEQHEGEPGRILEAKGAAIRVLCGSGVLELLQVKPPGRRPMATRDFLNGARLSSDCHFSIPKSSEDSHESD